MQTLKPNFETLNPNYGTPNSENKFQKSVGQYFDLF